MDRGAYGKRVGSPFGPTRAPAETVRARIEETVDDNPDLGGAPPMRPEEAFLVHVMAPDFPGDAPPIDDKSVSPAVTPTGIAPLSHSTRDSIAKFDYSSGDLAFYLPRAALDEIAEHIRERCACAPNFRHGHADDDALARRLRDAARRALRAYVAHAYGSPQATSPGARGGLASWQERRAKELLSGKLNDDMPVARVARECGLSASHFARAFRRSLGTAPHQWRLSFRVERAKEQLAGSDASLADIAVACGFADQSHFSRIFTKHAGCCPGQWRRKNSPGRRRTPVGPRRRKIPLP
jgi:AraC-like DNA-binding protein